MADLDSAPSAAAGSAPSSVGDSSPAPASSASDTSSSAPSDSRSIAAELLSDSGAPPEAPPAPESADPSQPPAAATSGEDDADYQNLLASGQRIPLDRHKAALTNARQKTRAEVEAEYRAKYAWADQMDRARADQALGLMQAFDKNPEATLRTLAAALGISFQPQPQAPAEPEGPPPPDVRLDDGSEFYSAKQLAKLNEWQQKQFDARLQQVTARYEPLIQRQVRADMQRAADTEAGTTLAECRAQWPQFQALEGDIKARMVADPQLSLDRAYIQAFAAKGLPALQQQYQTDRASQLSRKAAASAPPPGAPSAVTPLRDRDRSTADIAREVAGVAGL